MELWEYFISVSIGKLADMKLNVRIYFAMDAGYKVVIYDIRTRKQVSQFQHNGFSSHHISGFLPIIAGSEKDNKIAERCIKSTDFIVRVSSSPSFRPFWVLISFAHISNFFEDHVDATEELASTSRSGRAAMEN